MSFDIENCSSAFTRIFENISSKDCSVRGGGRAEVGRDARD